MTYSFTPINTNQKSDAALTAAYKARQQNFEQNTLPMLNQLAEKADSRDLVNSAKQQAADTRQNITDMSSRVSSRYAGSLTPAQQMQLQKTQDKTASLTSGSIVNQSRTLQRSQNEALQADLMQASDDLINNGTANLSQISANEQQRKAQAAQAKSSFMSSALSLTGAVVGSIVAPGGGTYIGASIGGMSGSAMGY